MQIPEEIKQCVVFLGYKRKNTKEICLTGTGFFVQANNQVFLVTARHNIAKVQSSELSEDNKIWIRLNKQNSGIEFISYNITDFISHPNTDISTDVVILPIENDLDQKKYEYKSIPEGMILNSRLIKEKNIGIGDEVFMTGLFTNHFGKEKNIPIVRIGNIAAMPDEPIHSADFGNLQAYLVELRSLGGLSGSPVFVYLNPSRIINGAHNINPNAEFFLLGLLHGHWDLKSATKGVELDQFGE